MNSLVVVPTMLHMLLKEAHNRFSEPDGAPASTAMVSQFAGLTSVVVGGQPMSRRLEGLARVCIPEAKFVQTYACTEGGSTITFACSAPFEHVKSCDGSRARSPGCSGGRSASEKGAVGRGHMLVEMGGIPAKHVEIRVVEHVLLDTCNVLSAPPGVVGEVETRGPHVMKGYWGKPDLTAAVLRPDGWLRTGDLGLLDEQIGRLVIVGRIKNMIKTGGENVYASEVESVLVRHKWVAEAAVYGVEDERLGEKVAASVVLSDAVQDQAENVTRERARLVLSEFCQRHLSPYKQPRRIDVVLALPRNSAGKVLRHKLKASL